MIYMYIRQRKKKLKKISPTKPATNPHMCNHGANRLVATSTM